MDLPDVIERLTWLKATVDLKQIPTPCVEIRTARGSAHGEPVSGVGIHSIQLETAENGAGKVVVVHPVNTLVPSKSLAGTVDDLLERAYRAYRDKAAELNRPITTDDESLVRATLEAIASSIRIES